MNASWLNCLPAFVRTRLEGRQHLQKALENAGWLLSDRIFRMGVSFLVGVWTARYLGPQLYGQLSYALAFTLILSPISDLGLDGIVQREIILDPSARDRVLGSSFLLTAAGGIVTFVVAVAGIFWIRPDDSVAHALVSISAAGTIFQAFIAVEYWYESQVQSKKIVTAKFSAFVITNFLKIVILLLGAPLVAFAWVGLAEAAIGAAGLVITYRMDGNRISDWRSSGPVARKLLHSSWPIILTGIMTSLSMRIDQVMLREMVGESEVGIYSVAVRLTETWFFIPLTACSSAFPAIMASWTSDKELFYRQIQKLYNSLALIAYAIAVPVSLFSGWIVRFFFGAAYERSGPLLAVLIWSVLIMNLGSARTLFLISMGWNKILFVTISLGCFVNIGLNFVLIPKYGAMGAAVSTCVSYWFASHGSCFLFKSLRRTGAMMTKAIVWPRIW